MIKLKRIYDKPEADDGVRILVDRLWPRGVSKAAAKIDIWLKEVAPSDELRKWFSHDAKKCGAFRTRYFRELDRNAEAVSRIGDLRRRRVTLLYAAKADGCNNATVLKEYLAGRA